MAKLDIIIPMYNSEEFVDELFEAFCNQTNKCFRIIAINDGSTDNTLSKIENYKTKVNFELLILNQTNQGVSVARNYGIKESISDIVVFFDSDDLPEVNYVEVILSEFSANVGVDSLIFSINFFREYDYKKHKSNSGLLDGIYSNIDLLHAFFEGGLQLYVFSMAIKREILIKNGVFFLEGYKNLEDVNFCYQMLSISNKIAINNSSIYNYRVREISATTKYNVLRDWKKSVEVMSLLNDVFMKTSPEFGKYYFEFGVPRIIWSITWQSVKLSKSFRNFLGFTKEIETKKHFKKLIHFPKKRIALSSRVFLFCPLIYYMSVLFLGRRKNRSKENKNETI